MVREQRHEALFILLGPFVGKELLSIGPVESGELDFGEVATARPARIGVTEHPLDSASFATCSRSQHHPP